MLQGPWERPSLAEPPVAVSCGPLSLPGAGDPSQPQEATHSPPDSLCLQVAPSYHPGGSHDRND